MRAPDNQLSLFPDAATVNDAQPGVLPGFTVRESGRAKRLSIKVYPRGRVEIVVPKRTRPADIAAFVTESRDWIIRSVAALKSEEVVESNQLPSLIELPAIGRRFVVTYRPTSSSSVRTQEIGSTVVLRGATRDVEQCRTALRRWLARLGKQELAPRLAELSRKTGLSYRRVQIRAQRTCWGSHSSSGTISLNLSLLFVPPDVLRYLLVHELCHARHMNHSAAFWRLVGRFEPNYKRLDRRLSEGWRDVPAWLELN